MDQQPIVINKMCELDNYLAQLNSIETIILFDIDNTLLRTKTNLGSVEWIKWQERLIQENSQSEYRIANTHEDLKKIYIEWINSSFNQTALMEVTLPAQIGEYIKAGFKVVLISSRDNTLMGTTVKQLSEFFNVNDFFSKGLSFENDYWLYENGIFLVSGRDKGVCTEFLLMNYKQEFNYQPINIVFVDDTLTECENVIRHLHETYNVLSFNYLYGKNYELEFEKLDKKIVHQEWLEYINKKSIN